ncbi:MAG: sialate O-acetylesterase [Victivallales bacterium]|jgi:sialate O-acetylesterase
MRFILMRFFCCGLLFLTAVQVHAKVKMPAIFGDHMVLQQDGVLPVWGWADPGEKVKVTLGDRHANAVAAADGKWRVELPSVKGDVAPLMMRVEGESNVLEFSDVLVGDVWICSGQSNMGIPLRYAHNAATELPKAVDPQLRFFLVPQMCSADPQEDTAGRWELCTKETAGGFSAVGYFFARELRRELKRPIGMIGSYWGGTPAQTWTSMVALEKAPAFTKYVDDYQRALKIHKKVIANPQLTADYEAKMKKWDEDYRAMRSQYNAALAAGQKVEPPKPDSPPPIQPDPTAVPNPANARPGTPSIAFNGMIAPLIPYAIKGVIWYQGEGNAYVSSAFEYRTLLPRLIEDWRGHWRQGDFPFIIVQLPNFIVSENSLQNWPMLRESQLRTLSLPNTGMAVTIDIGNPNDVHPKGKLDVGLRLALVARKVAYGQDIVFSGPIYDAMKVDGKKIRLSFKNVGGGLAMGVPPWTWDGKTPVKPEKLKGFSISGSDQKWFDAEADIEGGEVVVHSETVPVPVAVRYAWASNPSCNLYNKEGLPASPFRTDDWEK